MPLLLYLAGDLRRHGSLSVPFRLDDFSQDGKRDFIRRDSPNIETGGRLERAEPLRVDACFRQLPAQSLGLLARTDEGDVGRRRFECCFERRAIPLALCRDDDETIAVIFAGRLETIGKKIDFSILRMVIRRGADDHEKAEPLGEFGQRDTNRRSAEDDELRTREYRLDEDIHRALAWTHIFGEFYPFARLARRDAKLVEEVLRLHADEARFPVLDHVAGDAQ